MPVLLLPFTAQNSRIREASVLAGAQAGGRAEPAIRAGAKTRVALRDGLPERPRGMSIRPLAALWPRQRLWAARSCTGRHGFPHEGQF